VKDLAIESPLTSGADRVWNRRFVDAARDCGYLIVEGQALAYVPIDFGSVDEYLARLSSSRRSNFKRKLRARDKLDIAVVPTGEAFTDDAVVDAHYALYENVYAQSDVHFDKLTRDFFAAAFRGPGGIVFAYRRDGLLIGWNLCYEYDGKLIWKYVGYLYPNSREVNLYFVGWFVHLEYALSRGLTHYVAGWTDPVVKKGLGAKFHLTHHAVYVRSPALRAVLKRFAHHFESDSERITDD
jgi:predicted N-acyltransferase